MRILISAFAFALLAVQLSAQQFRYAETVFERTDTLKNVEYATAEWLNNPIAILSDYNVHDGESRTETRPLFMDIFTPHGDTVTQRPAILFLHSGAFMLGSRKNDDMIALCDSFARRGYVTATIDYRLGMGAQTIRLFGILIHLEINEKNANRATYRAVQDSRAAVRFLKHNAGNYHIDTTKIYMAGSSAGAITALSNIYVDKEVEVPADIFTEPALGGLDLTGVQGHGSKPNAVVSLWGAIQNTNVIEEENTPVLLVHGKADNIVPFGRGIPLDGMIEPNPNYSLTMPETSGSFCIDTALNNRNILHETYFVEDKKHEFYGVVTGNFPDEGPNQYWDTIQQKTANFLFHQFQPEAIFETETNGLTVIATNKSDEISHSFWEFETGETAAGETVSHTFSKGGVYKIKLTTCNRNLACDTLTKSVAVGNSVAVSSFSETTVKVFPNPVKTTLFIEGANQNFHLKVYDLTGRERITTKNSERNSVDVTRLENGLYILEIQLNGGKLHRRFLKQN